MFTPLNCRAHSLQCAWALLLAYDMLWLYFKTYIWLSLAKQSSTEVCSQSFTCMTRDTRHVAHDLRHDCRLQGRASPQLQAVWHL